jgi:hypothetical protein
MLWIVKLEPLLQRSDPCPESKCGNNRAKIDQAIPIKVHKKAYALVSS